MRKHSHKGYLRLVDPRKLEVKTYDQSVIESRSFIDTSSNVRIRKPPFSESLGIIILFLFYSSTKPYDEKNRWNLQRNDLNLY